MPWYSHEIDLRTGQQGICCWLSDETVSRNDLQQAFLEQSHPAVCQRCWHHEAQGLESRRQMESRFLDHKLDRDIGLIQQDAENGQAFAALLQIYVGSTCNGTCVTCGPGSSTAWQSLQGHVISIRQEHSEVTNNLLTDQHRDWSRVARINLLGGEPLLIPATWQVLDLLVQANNLDCRVSLVTNGSVKPTTEQLQSIQKFSDINVCVSVDAIGRGFEYLRYPLSWDRVRSNLDLYREIFSEVTVSFTVSNLNWHLREETKAWFNANDLRYIENPVQQPRWFRSEVQPGHSDWPKFVEQIQQQDRLKGISISDYLPYIHDLMIRHP